MNADDRMDISESQAPQLDYFPPYPSLFGFDNLDRRVLHHDLSRGPWPPAEKIGPA